jgi:hemolysin III
MWYDGLQIPVEKCMPWFDFREQASAWTHCAWLLLSFPATVVLWRRSRGDRAKQVSLLVFGISLVLCYAGSTLYHGIRLPEDLVEGWFATLDYIGIYLLIAGTITPLAVILLQGPWRWLTLSTAWLLAAVGIILRLVPLEMSRALSNALYLGMGWGAVLCYFKLARILCHQELLLVVVGGVLYSVGAVLNWIRWPVLWPGVFSTHDLYHLFVMGGSACHFWFMLKVVVPFQRPVEVPVPEEESKVLPTALAPVKR